jgi:hypothetical protein
MRVIIARDINVITTIPETGKISDDYVESSPTTVMV